MSELHEPYLSQPTLLLGFYQTPGGHNTTVYEYPVTQDEHGRSVPGAPMPVNVQQVKRLVEQLVRRDLEFLPEHVIAQSSAALAWWVPQGVRPLIFNSKVAAAQSINALSGEAFPHPPLLMVASRRQLQVFALAENTRPAASTPLFVAPYWNMFDHGTVCQGTVRYPARVLPEDTGKWTDVFFQSTFTGASRNRLANWGASHEEMWRHAQQLGHFPADLLLPEPNLKTVAEALK